MDGVSEAAVTRATTVLRDAGDAVAFTGAGVSTESGIPDFRSPGGLWDRFDPSDFSLQALERDPESYWERRREMAAARDFSWDAVEPNPAHDAIARLYREGPLSCVITQNVDGLHQAAGVGDADVLELHGTRAAAKCLGCGDRLPLEVLERKLDAVAVPRCDDCGGLLKHATVSFGERLPASVLDRARGACRDTDAVLVVGSSLSVEPAASLPRVAARNGAGFVVVNLDATPLDDRADAVLNAAAGEVLPGLVDRVLDAA